RAFRLGRAVHIVRDHVSRSPPRYDCKIDDERGARTGAGAFRPDGAALSFHDMTRDEQSETQTAGASRRGALGLPEALEHLREEARIDAAAIVGYSHIHGFFRYIDGDGNPTPRCRELHRI